MGFSQRLIPPGRGRVHQAGGWPVVAGGAPAITRQCAAPNVADSSPLPRCRSVEAARSIEHQMYFWGKDVRHPGGNLLITRGCRPSACREIPHQVRCYELETRHGRIVLHSTGVCLWPRAGADRGIAYLRPSHRLYHLLPGDQPLPCVSAAAVPATLSSVRPTEFPPALKDLLAFIHEYEAWAAGRWPAGARLEAWREFRRTAPRSLRWLPPEASARWLQACLAAA